MTFPTYPLTASQRMLHSALQEFADPGVMVIGVCAAIRAPIRRTVLTRCLKEELRRQQCLRIHFTPPDSQGLVRQYILPQLDVDIPYHDLRSLDRASACSLMTEWSTKGFSEPDAPLFRWSLVSLAHGWNGIYLAIDHRIIDSCGLISMMNDTMMLYCHECYGTSAPESPSSYETALQRDLLMEADEEQVKKDTVFWKQQLSAGEPVYTDITGGWKLEQSRRDLGLPSLKAACRTLSSDSGDMERFFLTMSESCSISDFCHTNGVSMTNLFLMAMRTCLSKACGEEPDISLRNYVSRRSSRLYKTCGGCRIHCYPCRSILTPDITLADGVRQIQALQNSIYRHSGFDPLLAERMRSEMYAQPAGTTYEGAALTCQPRPLIHSSHPLLRHLPLRTDWFSSKADIQKLYLTVMQPPGENGIGFYFKYQTAELDSQDVACFFQSLRHVLTAIASAPHEKLGTLLSSMPEPYLAKWSLPHP